MTTGAFQWPREQRIYVVEQKILSEILDRNNLVRVENLFVVLHTFTNWLDNNKTYNRFKMFYLMLLFLVSDHIRPDWEMSRTSVFCQIKKVPRIRISKEFPFFWCELRNLCSSVRPIALCNWIFISYSTCSACSEPQSIRTETYDARWHIQMRISKIVRQK